jgi:hypothetical protein
MKLKEKMKRFAAAVLSMTMALTCMSLCALAEEIATPAEPSATEVIVLPVEDSSEDSAAQEAPPETDTETPPMEAHEPSVPEDAANEPIQPDAEAEPAENFDEPADSRHPLQIALEEHSFVYVPAARKAQVYAEAALTGELIYITSGDVFLLLAVDFTEHGTAEVWFLDEARNAVHGFVALDDLDSQYLTAQEAADIDDFPAEEVMTAIGRMRLFVVNGSRPAAEPDSADSVPPMEAEDETPALDVPLEDEPHHEDEPSDADMVLSDEQPELPEPPADADEAEVPPLPEGTEMPSESDLPDVTEEPIAETPVVPKHANPGDYIGVTEETHVFSEMDGSASEEEYSEMYLGSFVQSATVQVLSVEMDEESHIWYQVRFLYGDAFPNGTLKWTDYATAWVLAAETRAPEADVCTATDYAFSVEFLDMFRDVQLYATPMDGFSLKNIHGSIGGFYAWQQGLYGSSGKDSAYPQIAKSASHGSIYATPHYLEGFTVFCLEHTLSGPGEGSGSNQTEKGPYVLVDLDAFVNHPSSGGASGVRFSAKTMHALGWVLRHTYPFMALDRSDANNETWSRVSGQFAMREVIKQLEGSQYVRGYWDMDRFYAFRGGAPAVYLTYARWLAENGIAHASISGKITVSNQSIRQTGGGYVGTMTLTTDADLIRIPKSAGIVGGNSGGSDADYYYARSGDTVTVQSSQSRFAVFMESVSSDTEEARFLVGVPSVSIQKVLVPVYGAPYSLQSTSVSFELSYGDVTVTKKSSDGVLLRDAVFELCAGNGTVLATAVTDAKGIAVFTGVAPGTYQVREKTAPQGYHLAAAASQNITVTAGVNTNVTFTNERIQGMIRIIKTDALTGKPLPGVVFTVTRLTCPASDNAADVGQTVAIITTNADGIAQTRELPWGQYKITETGVPDGYIDDEFETTVFIK